jgi:hypothetical protein
MGGGAKQVHPAGGVLDDESKHEVSCRVPELTAVLVTCA